MKGGFQSESDGDTLLAMLAALANPHRLRVIAALSAGGRNYVSRLAREIGISRPLLHLHLQKLEEAGLVSSQLELSADGKALKYFEVRPFTLDLTPASITAAAATLTVKPEKRRNFLHVGTCVFHHDWPLPGHGVADLWNARGLDRSTR